MQCFVKGKKITKTFFEKGIAIRVGMWYNQYS